MPVVYEIDRHRHLIHTRCIGPVTLPDVLEHFATLVRNPDRPDKMDVLLDLSETTSLPTTDQLRAVTFEIGLIRPHLQFGRCAIVTSNETWFGMARMFEVLAANYFHATHVFHTVGDAVVWLDSPNVA